MVQAKKDEVRKEIEYAALKVFFEKGYVDAKMSDIADEINISVGNIYTWISTKKMRCPSLPSTHQLTSQANT